MLEIFQFGSNIVGMGEKIVPVTVKLHTLTATQALALIDRDEITVEQYARALLKRIDERDETVKAWTYLGKRSSVVMIVCGPSHDTIHRLPD